MLRCVMYVCSAMHVTHVLLCDVKCVLCVFMNGWMDVRMYDDDVCMYV